MTDCVLAIDQGTTGTTALLLDQTVSVVASANEEFPNHYPEPGLVEHDLDEIWASVEAAVTAALANAGPVNIVAIGITNQRETCVFWDAATGEPIHRALVWQDRRTSDYCAELKVAGHEAMIRSKTGLVIDPYFSGTKAKWLLDAVEGARDRAAGRSRRSRGDQTPGRPGGELAPARRRHRDRDAVRPRGGGPGRPGRSRVRGHRGETRRRRSGTSDQWTAAGLTGVIPPRPTSPRDTCGSLRRAGSPGRA